jgi:NAD(P)H dehydrogenase (quinone)
MERRLSTLDLPITFLRPGWFMENTAWDVAGARDLGVLNAFLQPRERAIPMVATRDVAHAAADLLAEPFEGRRVVELEGPARVSPADIAATLGRLLGREVLVHDVPRATWDALFRSQGMTHPGPRIAMLDGFNEGWIAFEGAPGTVRRGTTSLETVLRGLIERAAG